LDDRKKRRGHRTADDPPCRPVRQRGLSASGDSNACAKGQAQLSRHAAEGREQGAGDQRDACESHEILTLAVAVKAPIHESARAWTNTRPPRCDRSLAI